MPGLNVRRVPGKACGRSGAKFEAILSGKKNRLAGATSPDQIIDFVRAESFPKRADKRTDLRHWRGLVCLTHGFPLDCM
jgi:hypothetical protein